MKIVGNVIYQYVCSREVSARDLEIMIPKAMALCVAIQTINSLRMTRNECGILEQVAILLFRMLWAVSGSLKLA